MQNGHNAGRMSIKSKLWLEVDDEPVFGRGRRFLLEAIERQGSINRAAREIEVTYKRAWSYIESMEKRLGVKLVIRRTGGRNGGGAELTDEAREFVRKYKLLEDGIAEYVDRRYREVFGSED